MLKTGRDVAIAPFFRVPGALKVWLGGKNRAVGLPVAKRVGGEKGSEDATHIKKTIADWVLPFSTFSFFRSQLRTKEQFPPRRLRACCVLRVSFFFAFCFWLFGGFLLFFIFCLVVVRVATWRRVFPRPFCVSSCWGRFVFRRHREKQFARFGRAFDAWRWRRNCDDFCARTGRRCLEWLVESFFVRGRFGRQDAGWFFWEPFLVDKRFFCLGFVGRGEFGELFRHSNFLFRRRNSSYQSYV